VAEIPDSVGGVFTHHWKTKTAAFGLGCRAVWIVFKEPDVALDADQHLTLAILTPEVVVAGVLAVFVEFRMWPSDCFFV
jgi:hypothetical protein